MLQPTLDDQQYSRGQLLAAPGQLQPPKLSRAVRLQTPNRSRNYINPAVSLRAACSDSKRSHLSSLEGLGHRAAVQAPEAATPGQKLCWHSGSHAALGFQA